MQKEWTEMQDAAYMYLCGKSKKECAKVQISPKIKKMLDSGMFTRTILQKDILKVLSDREHYKSCIFQKILSYNVDNDTFYPFDVQKFKNWTKTCKHNMLAVMINLFSSDDGHANMLIINKITKEIEHFEPHGDRTTMFETLADNVAFQRRIKGYLQQKLGLHDYKYLPPSKICPRTTNFAYTSTRSQKKGIQSLLNQSTDITLDIDTEYNGSCAIWSLWYLHNRLKQPYSTAQQVYEKLLSNIHDPEDPHALLNYITDFTEQLVALINIEISTEWRCGLEYYETEDEALEVQEETGCNVIAMDCPVLPSKITLYDYCTPILTNSEELFYNAYEAINFRGNVEYTASGKNLDNSLNVTIFVSNTLAYYKDEIKLILNFKRIKNKKDAHLVSIYNLNITGKLLYDEDILGTVYIASGYKYHNQDEVIPVIQKNLTAFTLKENTDEITAIELNEMDTLEIIKATNNNTMMLNTINAFIHIFKDTYATYVHARYINKSTMSDEPYIHFHEMTRQVVANITQLRSNTTKNIIHETLQEHNFQTGFVQAFEMEEDEEPKTMFPVSIF